MRIKSNFSESISFLLVIMLCLTACSSHNAPSQEIVTNAAKVVKGQNVSKVEILERLKPFEDSFTSPGDKTTTFLVRTRVTMDDGSSQKVELRIFKRHADDAWYVYRMGLGGTKIS